MTNFKNTMKHKGLLILPALIATISASDVSARENVGMGKTIISPSINAACVNPTVQSDLAVNNVRARILMGDMWWDLSNGVYIIPKASGIGSIFAGSLWIGGVDAGGQIKVAAQTYRQTGSDFWPGPLNISNATIDASVCAAYDKHFRITRKEVEDFVANGTVTPAISNWPGNGDMSQGQDQYLAPFFDNDGDGMYSPSKGDYPGYDLVSGDAFGDCQEVNCTPVDQLFGDETIWWVFNDKGNIHGETKGSPIGLEIRGQAFGFFTDDEVNNMTFYNYRIFNRSSYQVDSCYFGVWCDADLGDYSDDYVGCDVKRGFGFTYNADNDDAVGSGGYGANPPAVGIDYFRGPIANVSDGKDNNRNCTTDESCEQLGMSGFIYYNNASGPNGNPNGAVHFYNYLKNKWGDGSPVRFGGDGYTSLGPPCQFMYPGNPSSDDHDWSIGGDCSTGATLGPWDEVLAGNAPDDRRMLESAGPFTLTPGALNVVTTGVVWARATSGGAQASVSLLRIVDDKAQALFDNCFRVLDGPDAPDAMVQELDKKVILYLTNTSPTSNNYNETYSEIDPLISLVDTGGNKVTVDTTYNFEGYKIYQLKDKLVDASQLEDNSKARLVCQSDIKNGVATVINFEFDQNLGASVPKQKVQGKDIGVAHSYTLTTDAFATGDPTLINHKTYYYMAVAYGYNQFKEYKEDIAPGDDPFTPADDGQKKPYKQGRKNIKVYSAIPHNASMQNGGLEMHSEYGSGVAITRIEGNGNGGMNLDFNSSTVNAILGAWDSRVEKPTYLAGNGPVNIKVVDPLAVPDNNAFTLWFDTTNQGKNIMNSNWILKNNTTGELINSDKTIKAVNEQLILKWGISIAIEQVGDPGSATATNNGFLSATMTFVQPTKAWLGGLADKEGITFSNWIRSGTLATSGWKDYPGVDDKQVYEAVLGGTWTPYRLTAASNTPASGFLDTAKYYTGPGFKANVMNQPLMKDVASVNVVITSDKSKWSRCVVFEMCEDSTFSDNSAGVVSKKARKHDYRRAPSVDKNGNANYPSTDNNDFANGMGWFPGYAINLETGERLNIAFGENSALPNENGADMLWNPTSNVTGAASWMTNPAPVFGGQHYIYVFGHMKDNTPDPLITPLDTVNVPRYDGCYRIREVLGWDNNLPIDAKKREVFRDAMWVNIPLLNSGHKLLESDVTIKLRTAHSYKPGYSAAFYSVGTNVVFSDTASVWGGQNLNLPMYTFNTSGLTWHKDEEDIAVEALDLINVVPNPYYAYSNYETDNLDSRVKITNLPEKCTISIFNLGGTLVRKYVKGESKVDEKAFSSAITYNGGYPSITTHDGSLDWDLKNSANVPIASGVYIIHVDVPGVGEKVIKWFGILRTIDLDSF